MKILWLCNQVLPEIADEIGVAHMISGGWLTGLSKDLRKISDIDLAVTFPLFNSSEIQGETKELLYYSFVPQNTTKRFEYIIKDFSPDIIHIFGTEFGHTLDMVKVCESLGLIDKTIISIQGMVSVIARHYNAFLPEKVVNSFTLRDLLKQDNIKKQKLKFSQRGNLEIEAIKRVKHIIGRTDWDKACVTRVNPDVNYHFCNETLRSAFYEHKWKFDKCEKHSIFVSQCNYPLKGFHIMLEAMADIVKEYPDAKLYTTGKNLIGVGLKSKLSLRSYNKYIIQLINKYNLQKNICFLGDLNEEQMCERFLKSNVFVCCSSIENSPNSVGEAMLLGVPTVSSDVGGVKNMLVHNTEGYIYQADAPYMLSYYVKKLFADKELQEAFSENASKHAALTHNSKDNITSLINIYEELL